MINAHTHTNTHTNARTAKERGNYVITTKRQKGARARESTVYEFLLYSQWAAIIN